MSTVSILIFQCHNKPVNVDERSKACTVLALAAAGIVGSDPAQSMDVWYVYVFILCLCCPVFW
jgi:hypothetical protein